MGIVPRGVENFAKSGNFQEHSHDPKIGKQLIFEKDEPVSTNGVARRQPLTGSSSLKRPLEPS
jgi:hypothetical protein